MLTACISYNDGTLTWLLANTMLLLLLTSYHNPLLLPGVKVS